MSFISQGERIFGFQDPKYSECSPPKIRRSDHRLKRFYSTFDRRAWNFCDPVRYRHLYDLVSGSQTCLSTSQCHKYVPLEDLLNILMGQRNASGEREEQESSNMRQIKFSPDEQINIEAEKLLQEKVLALTQQLNDSRCMLRRAMHKLQNIDEIVNENKNLQCRLRCSEERIKYLEEKKKHLECELADLRSKSQIQIDLEKTQQMLSQVTQQREGSIEMDEQELQKLATERNELQKKVDNLEKELEESKKRESELELLKKQSQSKTSNLEEITRENECYKKKLASMKCLEKQIQELKKEGRALAEKYKRESQKAAEQLKKMCQATKELQSLQEERDSLRKRVDELASYECQFNALRSKLQRVDSVIAENELLNCKLIALEKLEKENEYLRCKLKEIQEMEVNAAEDREKISELQKAVVDQEEEMKDLLCQIERLTSGRPEEELERLKCELFEKSSKLKLCEEQLAEIPMLEAEIDELRMKLKCCCKNFADIKTSQNKFQKIIVKLPSKSKGISASYKESSQSSCIASEIQTKESVECADVIGGKVSKTSQVHSEKDAMSCEEVKNLLQSSKGIISCVLDDMIEHQKEMEELEARNHAMKNEIELLKAKVGNEPNEISALIKEIDLLKQKLEEKDLQIINLKKQSRSLQSDKENILKTQKDSNFSSTDADDEMDITTLKDLNKQMKAELEAACAGLKQVANLEKLVELERQARCKAEKQLKEGVLSSLSSRTPEINFEGDGCKSLMKEIEDLKLQIIELNKLTNELKKENELLRELQQPGPDFSKELDEKCALENLLSLLQAELDAYKGQQLSDECEALRNELKRVMEQNCQLKALVDCYRQRLDLEKKSAELERAKAEEPKRSRFSKEIEEQKVSEPFRSPESERDTKTPGKKGEIEQPEKSTKSEKPDQELDKSGETQRVTSDQFEAASGEQEKKVPELEDRTKFDGQIGVKMAEKPEISHKTSESQTAIKEGIIKPKSEPKLSSTVEPPKQELPEKQETAKSEITTMPEVTIKPEETTKSEVTVKQEPEIVKSPMEDKQKDFEGSNATKKPDSDQQKLTPGALSPGDKFPVIPEKPTSNQLADVEDEINRLKNLLAEKEKALQDQTRNCEEMLKARDDEIKSLQGAVAKLNEVNDNLKQAVQTVPDRPVIDSEKENKDLPPAVVAVDDTACEEKLKKLEADHAEKMKKLMEQHERELSNRDKAYNENLNAMKAGYETDIRKMAERHKSSVMRLQGLHEEEVQELNNNYETQMESMQTQSEIAMKDIARGSAAKIRKLSQQHQSEMRALESKLFDEGKKHNEEVSGLRKALTKSKEEVESLRKKAKDEGEGAAGSLKIRHSREMQKMRKGSLKRMSIIKDKYEELLTEEKKKSEAQIDTLKKKLKAEKEKGDGACDCKLRKKPRKPRDPTCPLDFYEVLEKILEQGLDSLTFNEIALVHRKTCCALEGIVMNSNITPLLEPPVGDGCPHTPLLQADKDQLLTRIFALENEIVRKQKETQETLINMEIAIKKERCRLYEVKNILRNEQQKNVELESLLSSQTKLQTDLRRERDHLGSQASLHQTLCREKTKELDQEKKNKKCLEEELEKVKSRMKQLCMALDVERENSKTIQKRDFENVQSMRTKLEQSVKQQDQLALQLENEVNYRIQLQCQLQTLRQSFQQMINLPAVEKDINIPPGPLEAKIVKEKQNLAQIRNRKNKTKQKCAKKHKK